jgi:hypothetical protein
MDSVPDTPDPQTRTAVTQRIIAHVRRGWPGLGEPIVRHRGQFCYVSALLPGYREAAPILRLRYQGSADRWAIGIYLASSDRYTESELPTYFGPKTGTPEEGVDDTLILYAGPKTGHLRPSAQNGPGPQSAKHESRKLQTINPQVRPPPPCPLVREVISLWIFLSRIGAFSIHDHWRRDSSDR